ncbi:MAG: type II secretion system F family protein [Nitrospirae bacterium]|nr:type II secretion system F family protein [Nitrospirota bacterium]
MPIFRYRGYNKAGSEISGVIEAEGQRDAAIKIKAGGVLPKEIRESLIEKKSGIFKRRHTPFNLPGITRRLAISLSSGVPLIDAVRAAATEQKGIWRNLLTDINEQVKAGASLSKALQAHSDIFPEFYTGMVAAGESSGRLPDVLMKLSDFLETESKVRNKVQTALVYPVFMASVSIIVVTFLFIFVVPKITKVFENTSAALPFITVLLIWISAFFQKLWWLLLLLAIAAAFSYRRMKETKKEFIDSMLLKDPSGILMSLYMMRFSMTMSFLLSGGLPILRAMRLTSRAVGNIKLKKSILAAEESVSHGARLSSSLKDFPPTMLQIISTGEQTGRLPEVLNTIADAYEDEFEKKLQRMTALLEPALILIMGLVVGFIVIAVLLPIFELNQLIK